MSTRNIIDHTNPGPIIGNITSPLFGQANQPSDAGCFGFSESAAHTVAVDSRNHRVYWPLQNVGGKPVLRITVPTDK